MSRLGWIAGAVLAGTSVLALAQSGPESLLPKGYDQPAPKAAPRAEPAAPRAPAGATPVIQALPVGGGAPAAAPVAATGPKLPSLDRLEKMTPEELEALLGTKPKYDVPASARRAVKRIGVIDEGEGGLPGGALLNQNASLVGALLAGNNGQIVSRWGHILLRRTLASRLDAPLGMNPADFVALRTALLVRMGEGEAARAVAQDVDVGNYNPALTQAAIDAYIATADFTGACPVVGWQGGARKDVQWRQLQGICNAFNGDMKAGLAVLDRTGVGGGYEKIDLLLSQRYAGAAGRGGRAVKIEWDNVEGLTPWRYSLTLALGLEPPEGLMEDAPLALRYTAATAPMASLSTRAAGADFAAATGILSASAMVDLYSQIFAAGGEGPWADLATQLQNAYLATDPADRLAAIKGLWGDEGNPRQYYSRQVLTAYAAARLPVDQGEAGDAAELIASMLAAGLDGNAVRWGSVVPNGSEAWALIALAQPNRSQPVTADQIGSFNDDDGSDGARKTGFLVAGLAGLNRLPLDTARDLAGKYEFTLERPSRWTQLIDDAADKNNAAMVALLAGAGMQVSGWDKMTARNLFHIVRALNKVGLSAEARMIAAEAVARG